MAEEKIVEKDDWNTILGELDEIVHETFQLAQLAKGDKETLEGNDYPALVHYITELKKEKKSQSWEKIEQFSTKALENLKLLEETQQIKMQNKRIDRSFIGILPKNTDEIGRRAIEIINEVPGLLEIINDSVEALLIDVKLKLDVPIIKFNKEILDIKHQIELLQDEIKAHTKTKKGRVVYTQAYRETYHEILDKAMSYLHRDFELHSKAFEHIYQHFQQKIKSYRESPAFDDFIKEQCLKIEELIETWHVDGFNAFKKAQKFVRKIDDRLSDTKQAFIQQIKAEFEKDVSTLVSQLEQLFTLENEIAGETFATMKAAAERVISASKFMIRTVDVVACDPHEKLINDEKILTEATKMATAAYQGTYGQFEEQIENFTSQIPLSKSSKKVLAVIATTKENSLKPNTLVDVVSIIPNILKYKDNLEILSKELAVDITKLQEKFLKKIADINKYLGQEKAIPLPEEGALVKLTEVDFADLEPLTKISALLKESLINTATAIYNVERKIAEGLGISIIPNLEAKVTRYQRPSYKPTVKQANKAMNDLEKAAKTLTKDTGTAIAEFAKNLKKFPVQTTALKTFQSLLKTISKEALGGKLSLTKIIARLNQAVQEYSKLLANIIAENEEDLALILKAPAKVDLSTMSLENFSQKHDELLDNISLESVAKEQAKEPELVCKKCGGKIVWQKKDYNDMLGLDVLLVRCENNHEDNIIGFGDEEEEEEPLEIKCSKCGSETLLPSGINIYTKDSLIVTATCPKNHKTDFIIKKK